MSPDPDLTTLINFVRDLVGDASSDGCDCGQAISDQQITQALTATRERVGEPLEQIIIQIPGAVRGLEWRSGECWFDEGAILMDGFGTPVPTEEITSADTLNAEWALTVPRTTLYVSGYRYDPYQAAADLLRQLRIKQRGMVDTSELGVSLKLSQALAVMESVELSYRRAARIRSVSFGRSDIA